MKKLRRSLLAVPTWVWVFVAITQVVTIVARAYELPELDIAIQQMSTQARDVYTWTDIPRELQTIRRQKRNDLIAASIFCPISIALAYWSWSVRRREGTKAENETGQEELRT